MKLLLCVLLTLSFSISVFAGRPSATDSSTLNFSRPAGYMSKYLNVDNRFTNDSTFTVIVTNINKAKGVNSCPIRTITTALGVTIKDVPSLQIGIFGDHRIFSYLDSDNYERWSGNLWEGVGYYSCGGNNCSQPYWISDYTALKLICAPIYGDWQSNPL